MRISHLLALLLSPLALAAQSRMVPRAQPAGSPVPLELIREEPSRNYHGSPDQIRATMLRLVGPLPDRTPLNPVVLGQTSLPGLRIEKILFDSQPGFHVTALLYLPEATLVSGLLPAILMAPGHYADSKAHDFATASAFARNGFAVLSYDPLGQGERLQYPNPRDPGQSLLHSSTGEHSEASLQPILLGESIAKYFLWDGIRALDYLETRPEIDRTRIGAFGCSGGGADTALLAAVDPRVAAVGTACYLTTWDALFRSIGPQEGEQSTPGWIAAGLDFADYVLAAAPRPYAIIATEQDMFPFAGTVTLEAEVRRYYQGRGAEKQLAFIHGPGTHGQLAPLLPRILRFFIDALHPALNAPIYDDRSPQVQAPPGALQVTPTGQVGTFDVNAETVFSLNLKHAAKLHMGHPETFAQTQEAVRQAAIFGLTRHPSAGPAPRRTVLPPTSLEDPSQPYNSQGFEVDGPQLAADSRSRVPVSMVIFIRRANGTRLAASFTLSSQPIGPATLALLLGAPADPAIKTRTAQLALSGHIVLTINPEPSSPGNADVKAPQLGPWYLPGLSAQLAGKSILGLRMLDTMLAVDYLGNLRLPHQPGIQAEASSHLALVLLHAAIFDTDPATKDPAKLTKILLHNLPPTYAQLLATPIPLDAPEDILPGVLLHYDIPDLIAALGSRVTVLP